MTRGLYTSLLHTYPPTLNRLLSDAEHLPLVRLVPVLNPDTGTNFIASITPHSLHPVFEDETDTGFRNIGQLQFDAGEIPKRIYTKKLTLFCSIRYKFTTKIGREKGTNINFAQLFTMYFTNPL